MSKTTTIARMRRDGVLVRIKPDGKEEVMPVEPPAPMTERRSKQPRGATRTPGPSRRKSSLRPNGFREPERCGGRSG